MKTCRNNAASFDVSTPRETIRITDVSITSSPQSGDTYRLGETIEVTLTFNQEVEVAGRVQVSIRVGEDRENWRGAEYLRGSGTDTLVFGHVVGLAEFGEYDEDGITVDGGYETAGYGLTGPGTIKAKGGLSAELDRTYDQVGTSSGHKVEGRLYVTDMQITSSPRSGDTYNVGEYIEITQTFSQDVGVSGKVGVSIRVGEDLGDQENWRGAYHQGRSGSDSLVFGYEVKADDLDENGITVDGGDGTISGYIGSGTIFSTVIADIPSVRPTLPKLGYDTLLPKLSRGYSSIGASEDHKVDGRTYVTGMSITSSPESGDTYRRGETIEITQTFSQPVQVNGDMGVSIRVGDDRGNWSGAYYQSGSGSDTLVFGYKVEPGDVDGDGISVDAGDGAISGYIGGGTITAVVSRSPALRSYPAIGDSSDHKVDTRVHVTNIRVVSTPADGETYRRDEVIAVELVFSAPVVDVRENTFVDISYEQNGIFILPAWYVSGSGTDTLRYEYTVDVEDFDDDGFSIGPGTRETWLGEGRIVEAGTDIPITHIFPGSGDFVGHNVDGVLRDEITSFEITSDPGEDTIYDTGDRIDVSVTFSGDVTVTGTPLLPLHFDNGVRVAEFTSVADGVVVFSYTVVDNDLAVKGFIIGQGELTLDRGSIQDVADNPAWLRHKGMAADASHRVAGGGMGIPVTISSIAFTSITYAAKDYYYTPGDVIELAVTFDADVVVTGSPQFKMHFYQSGDVTATFESATGPEVVFTYTVVLGDMSPRGIEIKANSLSLNGGTIQDEDGNNASLVHDDMGRDDDHAVYAPGGV